MEQDRVAPSVLFIMSLEPFLRAIRPNPNNKGVQVGVTEYKILAYADYLYFIKNPKIYLS